MFEPITVPSRLTRPDQFAEEAELAFNGIAQFILDYNYLGSVLNGAITSTSTTSLAIGTGTKSPTVQPGLNLVPGYPVRLAYTTDPTKYMDGQVTTYNSTTGALVANILSVNGSGTFADWQIMVLPAAGDYASKGANTFSGAQTVPNEDYDESTWNGNNTVPTKNAVRDKIQSVASTFVGSSKNLIVTNNASTPNSIMDITADEILLKNSSGVAFLANAVNLTIDIAGTGANGLDTGTEANSTWYYLWVIYNGTTVAGLLSTSSTAPTLPSGYTYKALLGAIYNGSGGNFNLIRQVGNQVFISRTTISTSVPGTTYASISLATIVPPNAKSVFVQRSDQLGASALVSLYTSPQDGDDFSYVVTAESGGSTSYRNNAIFELVLREVQTIYQKRSGTAPSTTAVYCTGWRY
jgi:hypothetical protein